MTKPVVVYLLYLLAACGDFTSSDISRTTVATPVDLFLVAGQSNARYQEGYVPWDTLMAQRGNRTAWPAFALRYYRLTGRRVAIVNAHIPGSSMLVASDTIRSIRRGSWSENGELFARSIAMLDSATTAHPDHAFKAVFWIQGEADARAIDLGVVTQNQYQRSLTRMIARYREIYGPVPVYIFKTGAPLSGDTDGFRAVRAAQSRIASNDPLAFIAFSRAVSFPQRGLMLDDLHYTAEGYAEMGRIGAGVVATRETRLATLITHHLRILYTIQPHISRTSSRVVRLLGAG